MDENYFRKTTTLVILAVLLVLSFFLLRPLLIPIIVGLVLAFVFSPIYNQLFKIIKIKNLCAAIICVLLILIIILPIWFFTPLLIDESIQIYRASQQLDIVTPLKQFFPSIFASEIFSQEAGSVIQSFITKFTSSLMTSLSNILLHFPTLVLQILVVFFTFFYALRDKENLINYIKSLLPFSKETEKKLFESTKDITFSVLYGNVIVGTIQGIILGIGFFIFGVPNALMLGVLGIVVGILPILGPSMVGVPTAIFLFVGGNSFSAIGILIFTLLSSLSDQILRPLFVSRRARLHNALVLVGMIGGFLFLGILGFILGPLIIAYLIIIIEVYRNKSMPSILIQSEKNNSVK